MTISDLITQLEELKAQHGDITVCSTTEHEHFGSIESHLNEDNFKVVSHAQPNGPTSGQSEKAVVFG